ncbi:hypothetical protein BCR36DRAFT_301451, partial [Piromyces finnis]
DAKLVRPFQILKNNEYNLSKPISHYAISEEVNKSIFIFGGIVESRRRAKFSNKLFRFSIPNKTLLEVNIDKSNVSMPQPRVGATITYIPTPFPHLILFGGVTESGKFKNDLWMFNIIKLEWEEINSSGEIPPPIELHTTTLWGKFIIVVGGLIKENSKYATSEDIYWLDLVNVKWHSTNGNILTSRANHSMILTHDDLFLFGGFQIDDSDKQVTGKLDKDSYINIHENIIKNSKIIDDLTSINIGKL